MALEIFLWICIGFIVWLMLISIINFVFAEHYYAKKEKDGPLVSILIPARNEEANIRHALSSVLTQNYKHIEVIVGDDHSDDATVEIVERFVDKDDRVKLISIPELADGWKGKSHACYHLAKAAKGEYLVFIDADVRLLEQILCHVVSFIRRKNLDFVSVFPKQIMITLGEFLTVPLMNMILLSLLPLPLVRYCKCSAFSAANGQFMMFKTSVYREVQPHELVKADRVEDIMIAHKMKQLGKRVSCTVANKNLICRMYTGWKPAIEGFSHNMNYFFGGSYSLGLIYWFFITLAPFAVFIWGSWLQIGIWILAYILMRLIISLQSRQKVWVNFLVSPIQHYSMLVILIKTIRHRLKKDIQWKGRNVF